MTPQGGPAASWPAVRALQDRPIYSQPWLYVHPLNHTHTSCVSDYNSAIGIGIGTRVPMCTYLQRTHIPSHVLRVRRLVTLVHGRAPNTRTHTIHTIATRFKI
jgi:hypothetical protein